MQRRRTTVAFIVIAGSALATTCIAAGGPIASKQRIAIEVKSNVLTGKGTFTLIPLSPGAIQHDSGRVVGGGDIRPSVVRRTGQSVTVILGTDELRGRRGTLRLSQRVENVDAGSSYTADTGSWTVTGGVGAYAALSGGGRLAGVGTPDGRIVYRQEGYAHASS